jgi:hypothetical protein
MGKNKIRKDKNTFILVNLHTIETYKYIIYYYIIVLKRKENLKHHLAPVQKSLLNIKSLELNIVYIMLFSLASTLFTKATVSLRTITLK